MDLKAELTHKLGPLPVWAWAGIVTAGVVLIGLHAKSSATGATGIPTGDTSSTPGALDTGDSSGGDSGAGLDLGGGPALPSDLGATSGSSNLDDDFAALEAQLSQLQVAQDEAIGGGGQTSGSGGGSTGGGSTGGSNSGAQVTPASIEAALGVAPGSQKIVTVPGGNALDVADIPKSLQNSPIVPIKNNDVAPVKTVATPAPKVSAPIKYFTYRSELPSDTAVGFTAGKGYYDKNAA